MLAIYARKSNKSAGVVNELSIHEQKSLGIEFAKKSKLKYKVYIDEYVSGTKKNRPALDKLRSDIIDGLITGLYFQDQTRLERNPSLWDEFKALRKSYNLTFFTDNGIFNLDDLGIELVSDLISVVGAFYVKQTSEKVKKVLNRKASEGKLPNGMLNMGYKRDESGAVVIDKENEKFVRMIFDLSLKGYGVLQIAKRLNELGVKPIKKRGGGQFEAAVVYKILKNPVYKGVKTWGKYTFKIPAYFDEVYFDRIQKNLKANSLKSGKETSKGFLLRGILACRQPNCKRVYSNGRRKLICKTDVGKRRVDYYRCNSSRELNKAKCSSVGIRKEEIDEIFWILTSESKYLRDTVIQVVKDKQENSKIDDLKAKLKAKQRKLKEVEKSILKLVELASKGILTDEEIASKMKSNRIKKNDYSSDIIDLKKDIESYSIDAEDTIKKIEDVTKLKRASDTTKKKVFKAIYKEITYERVNDAGFNGFEIYIEFTNPNIPTVIMLLDHRYRYASVYNGYTKHSKQPNFKYILRKGYEGDIMIKIPQNVIEEYKGKKQNIQKAEISETL